MARSIPLVIPCLVLPGLVAVLAGDGPPPAPASEAREPPLIFRLEVDGRAHRIEPDRPLKLPTGAGTTTVTLRVEPHRVFAYGGLHFHYPRSYAFEADLRSPELSRWTLDGDDCVLMVFRFPGQTDPERVLQSSVREMRRQFGGLHVQQSDTTLALDGRKLAGKELRVELAGQRLVQSFYAVRAGDAAVVLVIQDTPRPGGDPSPDRVRAEEMLARTFRVADE
ncbi:MAG: hypothetical protein ACE5JG_11445 [Planctomycetota bacterium]